MFCIFDTVRFVFLSRFEDIDEQKLLPDRENNQENKHRRYLNRI